MATHRVDRTAGIRARFMLCRCVAFARGRERGDQLVSSAPWITRRGRARPVDARNAPVHGAAMEHELSQRRQASCSEEGARSSGRSSAARPARVPTWSARRAGPRLVAALAAAPGTQEDAAGDGRVLAEVTAQLAPQQVTLGRGERGGRIGLAARRLVVAPACGPRDLYMGQRPAAGLSGIGGRPSE